MIIDLDMLVRFGACKIQRRIRCTVPKWTGRFGPVGTAEERSTTWRILLAERVSPTQCRLGHC